MLIYDFDKHICIPSKGRVNFNNLIKSIINTKDTMRTWTSRESLEPITKKEMWDVIPDTTKSRAIQSRKIQLSCLLKNRSSRASFISLSKYSFSSRHFGWQNRLSFHKLFSRNDFQRLIALFILIKLEICLYNSNPVNNTAAMAKIRRHHACLKKY